MEEKKKYCTIKERKKAARILAAHAGLEKINDEIIQQVGAMSDTEILKFLDNELRTPAGGVEVLQPGSVEEIKPGEDPENIYKIMVDTARAYIDKNNWDGEKISPLQWGAVCLYVGIFCRSLFRGSDNIKDVYGNKQKAINAQAVAGAVPVWLSLCYEFNKAPLICNFCDFCGISQEWLLSGVTPECVQLHKMLEKIQADGLRQRVINPKESPIGAIFLLKADHGLVEATKVQHEYIKPSETAQALPVFGSFDALPDENGQK